MNKKLLILLAFVIPFLTIGAGCAKPVAENQISTNNNIASSTNFYENTEYGFSLNFPANWGTVKEETKTATIFNTVRLTAENDLNRYIQISVVKVGDKKSPLVVDYPHSYLIGNKTYAYYYSGGGDYAGYPDMEDQKYFDIAKEVKGISETFKLIQEESGWKTFLGSQFQFSFKYPNDWFIIKGVSEKSLPEAVFISKVQLKEGGEDLGNLSIVINKSSLEKNIRKNLISREEITFAGRPATKIKFTGDWGSAKISILVPYGDYTFVITYNPEDKDYSSIEKTLSSFYFEKTVEGDQLLSYSTDGVPVTVSKTTAPFGYTAKDFKGLAVDCGSQREDSYFDKLVIKFSNTIETTYTFKYKGVSQDSGKFLVTLIPNKAGYTSLEQFKKDFDICAAGGGAYPNMLNSSWLLFVSSCGSGYDDGSGQPHGCDEIKKIIAPTLKLN